MKYKVIVWRNNAGTEDDLPTGNFSFFRLADAVRCAQSWSGYGAVYSAWVYDGDSWQIY